MCVTVSKHIGPERGEGDMYVTVSKHIGPERGEGDMCVTVRPRAWGG